MYHVFSYFHLLSSTFELWPKTSSIQLIRKRINKNMVKKENLKYVYKS